MQTAQDAKDKTRITFIGKFTHLHDEEYIARSFEDLGCQVDRLPAHVKDVELAEFIRVHRPNILLYTKYDISPQIQKVCQAIGTKTVCWLFDLYFDYTREYQVKNKPFFKSDYVFTTDGGHDHRWLELGINHHCVRQGIYAKECYKLEPNPDIDVAFIGCESPVYPERTETMNWLAKNYNFRWYGRKDTNEVRGEKLNILFAHTKVVVGDSFPSPRYWSNRVVETLGRGGFLIHREVEGIKEEYPDLVTYDGTKEDLKQKIDYYLTNEKERLAIVKKNLELVKSSYTMTHKCQELLNYIS